MEAELRERSGNLCELCKGEEALLVYAVPPKNGEIPDECAYLCATCIEQIQNPEQLDENHWRILGDSMWSEVPAVQVLSWRMLQRLRDKGWPVDLLDMLYLDEQTLAWAESGAASDNELAVRHIDSNGNPLNQGDNVVLIQDLNVKGGGFTAKRGTAVRNIHLDRNNGDYIEGKVNGQLIAILTKYVKKN